MADPKINRDAWARVLRRLIDEESDGNQTRFAEVVGVDRKTVARWLQRQVDVSEDKVRAVARALGLPARNLLIDVGYYRSDELASEPTDAPEPPDEDDPIELVRRSNLTLSAKRELIEYLTEQRQRQLEETRRLIDMAARRRRRAG